MKRFRSRTIDQKQKRPKQPPINKLDPSHQTNSYQTKPNLLEIKLKDLDSEPEVYYKGEQIFDNRLQSIRYDWEPSGETFGEQLIEITGYDVNGYRANKHPSLDTIKHERHQ